MLAVIRYHGLRERKGRCCSESLAGALRQLAWASSSRCPHGPGGLRPSGLHTVPHVILSMGYTGAHCDPLTTSYCVLKILQKAC